MRSFRRDRVNLRDTRISYVFLISLAFVCTVMVIIITRQENLIHSHELEAYYESLTLCGDALDEWRTAPDGETRRSAIMRFRDAVKSLPSGVEAESFFVFADNMRNGNESEARVRALTDTFMLLSSIDYANADEAEELIGITLNGVADELGLYSSEAESTAESVAEILPEVKQYTRNIVNKSIRNLFGKNSGTLEPLLSESGDKWLVENSNLRMSFSASDGNIEEFVYIRLGSHPGEKLEKEERVSCVQSFFCQMRRTSANVQMTVLGEMCGFLLVGVEEKEQAWQSAVDEYGRIWSLIKVKR